VTAPHSVWLLATTNLAKRHELGALLAATPVTWRWLGEMPDRPAVAETGATFDENAVLKARAYAAWSGMPALADDGGLEIDALGGAPGVRSHRWGADRELSDAELIATTMEQMRDIAPGRRGAQMRVVLALALPGGAVYTAGGALRGTIAERPTPHLDPGFPYRSLFVVPAYDKYFVDLTPEEHEAINHRRNAVQELTRAIAPLLDARGNRGA